MTELLDTTWTTLGERITQIMARKHIPGVAAGVLYQGQTQTTGFGITNVDHPLPVTDETLFQIGSITKTFVGTAIMRLVEQGKVDLDATVRTYLPGFRVADEAASQGATVRHLLTHTGGWAGDIVAMVAEEAFFWLDAPIKRVSAPDTPVPFAPMMEQFYVPSAERVVQAVRSLF